MIARDHGPGIPNLKGALQTSYSVAGGLGLGLRGVKGLMDSLDIITVPSHEERGLGLVGLRERLDSLRGTLGITSLPGQGTELLMYIPLEG